MEDYKKTDDERDLPKRPWDTCREVPIIEDEQTPWKMIKLLRTICLLLTAIVVFGLALCSKTSFLLLITLSNEGTRILSDERKPVALLCIGCALMTPSVLLFLQSIWKACYKTSKSPAKATIALVLFFEFLVSLGAAILTIVAMPHLDIVTNVTILNGVAVLSALLQVITQCTAKERNRYLLPSITALLLILLGYVLFLFLYITKDPTNTKMSIWVGLAVGGSFFVSLNWWENYLRLISKNSSSVILKSLCMDVKRSQNMLNMLTSLLRIVVIGCVLGAYVPLAKMDWDIVNTIPSRETRIIGILIGVQLISSVLCHWFSLAACKMHALRRCFILPIYFASLAVMALLVIPVIVYYQDYRISLNGTTTNFTSYCSIVVDGRSASLNGSVFPDLVYDVTHSLCYLDMSKMMDIGLLTGSAVSWWLGLVLATIHLWHLSLYRIQRTQELFIRRLYEGGFMEQSLLLNTRFDVQTTEKRKKFRSLDPAKVYLCATMWHETYDEMMKIIISIFRLDKYRPLKEGVISDVTFEGHVYFDDAFKNVTGSHGRHVNEYGEMLVNIIREVYGIFINMDKGLFKKRQQIPNQGIVRTSYGGRLVFTLPQGNSLTVHFKDKHLIRHKKRWSQVMYLYYLLGWKLSTKYFKKWNKVGVDEAELKREFQKEKHNTYILALDGDTDFHPAAVMLLVDRLKLYPQVGAACGRIHPTGSGPMVWYQKFEYAVGHWLHKTAEHVYGCVLCSPGCFSLFRASALMDNNVMKKYTVKASKPADHIQYDQGEDRWLCTLLLKQGWRVEYNAAADAYTNAPEEFKEFFNQRRRWGPSTMANIVDLLGSTTLLCKRNPSMSKPYMVYQLFSLASSILSPSTVVLMIAGSLTILLDIHPNWALVIAVIPPAIFLGVSFKIKADTQITIAAFLGILYAFLMMISALVVVGNMVEQQTIMTPSSLFIISLTCFYLFTALLHPQEVGLIVFGLLYIICIPSAYLLLSIYSMVNMNNVSWGTRETAAPAGAAQQAAVTPQTQTQKAKNALTRFFMQSKCCRKMCRRDDTEELIANQENRVMRVEKEEIQPQNTIVGDVTDFPTTPEPVFTCPNQCWVTQLQSLSDDMLLQEDELDQDEDEFFRDMTTKYLEPLPEDKKKQKEMAAALSELRNKITFVYFICNAFWLIATFTLQLASTSVFIQVPKVDINMQPTGEYLFIEPVGFMFIIAFALLVLVQFIAMLYHRTYTLIHFIAFLDTEATLERRAYETQQVTDDKDNNGYNDDADEDDEDEDEDEDDRDSLMFSSMYSRSQESGTMV
ncbi:chitin synthase chs-2-like [Notolabrus celidotus]|uniref:chitin synthase chs-2-like n=1 Tax=Notolabrus celidotus TaxID=1203425 RepID=UPI00148F93F1|nr:chitin synthase chs-2-like [Notolabrus celidotus]